MNSDVCYEQLDCMFTILKRKYPALVNKNNVLLQQDTARPRAFRKIRQKQDEFDGMEFLSHPPYSPDLASSDFHFFRSIAYFLSGHTL